ncbi:hypothetical protein M427DRAFT_51157 [Gonapodya prolifera JEL478]|uniref:Zn(2)-C6 fungal-type domain-containing protein n=1 Tax=Gonapodya prolifera (strain JEL478) TaxID=1344416 RepID=A0A139AYI8_GONPJ|nr:hypothetical protein M427DRAFT_51157 [Gonapodya prolifera JEL478]|eukprot:KXS21777.1 hypothetical protein M427DRAFT_51157 [Gonapodya prolifera JEL478]
MPETDDDGMPNNQVNLLDMRKTCVACVKRKIRCDSELGGPCSRCVRLGIDCRFDSRAPRKTIAKRTVVKHAKVTLADRIKLLEAILGGDGPVPVSEIPSTMNGSVKSEPDDVDMSISIRTVVGTTGNIAHFDHWEFSATPYPSKNVLRDVHQLRLNLPHFPSLGIADAPSIFDDLPEMPSQSLVHSLIQLYFGQLPASIPTVHRQSFLNNPNPPILVLSVLTVGAELHDDAMVQSLARSTFFPRLQRLLKIETEKPTLAGITSMLHAVFHSIGKLKWDHVTMYLSQSVTAVRCLGLHFEHTINTISSQWVEQEWARRLFWNTFLFDRTIAAARGVPKLLNDEESMLLRLPCPNWMWDSPMMVHVPPVMPTLEEFFTPGLQHNLDLIVFDISLYSLFGRVIEVHQLGLRCASHASETAKSSWAHQISTRNKEIEGEISLWEHHLNAYASLHGGLSPGDTLYLQMSLHGLRSILHGPSVTNFRLMLDLLLPYRTPARELHSPIPAAPDTENMLKLWVASPSFVVSLENAFEAVEIVSKMRSLPTRTVRSPTFGFFLNYVGVVFLLTSVQMLISGIPPSDLRVRMRSILASFDDLIAKPMYPRMNFARSVMAFFLAELERGMGQEPILYDEAAVEMVLSAFREENNIPPSSEATKLSAIIEQSRVRNGLLLGAASDVGATF